MLAEPVATEFDADSTDGAGRSDDIARVTVPINPLLPMAAAAFDKIARIDTLNKSGTLALNDESATHEAATADVPDPKRIMPEDASPAFCPKTVTETEPDVAALLDPDLDPDPDPEDTITAGMSDDKTPERVEEGHTPPN